MAAVCDVQRCGQKRGLVCVSAHVRTCVCVVVVVVVVVVVASGISFWLLQLPGVQPVPYV